LDGIDVIDNEPPVVWISSLSLLGIDGEDNYVFCEDEGEIGCDSIDQNFRIILSIEENGYVHVSSSYSDESSGTNLEEYEWHSDLDGILNETWSQIIYYENDPELLSEGTHNISVRGMDSFGEWSEWSESIQLEIVYNVRPVVKQIYITDQHGHVIHESHKHFCCGEIYFEAEIEAEGEIVEYEWYDEYSGELISTSSSFTTSDYYIGHNTISLRVKDDLGIWSNFDQMGWGGGDSDEWFFAYPNPPYLEISVLMGDEYDGGQNITFEIKAIIDQHPYEYNGDDTHNYHYYFKGHSFAAFTLPYDHAHLTEQDSWFEYGSHEVHFELCHMRSWAYVDDEYQYLCSDTSIDVRINTPPTASIADIANSDSPVSSVFMDKIFFEGKGTDEDGEIVEYEWFSSIDKVISTNKTFSKSDLSLGKHIIILSVMDNDGKWSESESFELFIYTNPIAHAGDDITIVPGTTVQFAGAGTDEDGEIVKYEWDLNGDGIFEFKSENTGLTTFIYNSEGSFTVTLRVTDNDGNIATDEIVVSVENPKIIEPDEGLLPSTSVFTAICAIAIIAFRRR